MLSAALYYFSVLGDLSLKPQTNQSMLTFKVTEGQIGIF